MTEVKKSILELAPTVTIRDPFELSSLTIEIDSKYHEFDGYSFVQLTDFHHGPCTPLTTVIKSLDIVKDLKPDALFLCGDYLQLSATGLRHYLGTKVSPKYFGWATYRREVRSLAKDFGAALANVKLTDGIFAILGNHDYHEGVGTLKRQFPRDVTWLVNQTAKIRRANSSIHLAGLDDYRYGEPKLSTALSKEEHAFSILLNHNPDVFTFEDADKLGNFDLILCGHTHGGQICLPGRKALITRTKQKDHFSGLSKFKNSTVYVNRGVGCGGIPLRLFCPPEILHVTLKASNN